MSGRRRRDDGWDDGRLDAQDDRRGPWAEDATGEWGARDAGRVEDAGQPRRSAGGAAGAYVRNAPPGGTAYAAPDFPSFQAAGGSSSGDRYGASSGNGGQRGASNGYAPAGYGGGRDAYQGAGHGRDSGRRDAGYGGGAATGYGRPADGSGGRGNDPGYGGANGRTGGSGYAPGFAPADNDELDDDGAAGTPRPYGRLSIYTLHEDKAREFDRLAERAAEGVRVAEPDTLVYVIHVVPKAPQQRIIYEIYRDRAAFVSHERQPHIRQFAADRASCVLATNIIDLRLKYAKVAALGSSSEPATQAAPAQPAQPGQQATWSPRGAEPVRGGSSDRRVPAIQYSPTQYNPASQYPAAQQQRAAAASFTPAADSNQYPTVGRDAYNQAPQYGNSGNSGYGTTSSQYGAANRNGYSGAPGYANGGSYSSNAYPSSNGYQGGTGYSGDNGYPGANGYSNANGYGSANGYANGANGYGSSGGYPNSGYGAAGGYPDNGAGSYSASASTQYTPRYRELTSGSSSDARGGRQGDGRQPEWDQRSQGYR